MKYINFSILIIFCLFVFFNSKYYKTKKKLENKNKSRLPNKNFLNNHIEIFDRKKKKNDFKEFKDNSKFFKKNTKEKKFWQLLKNK